jgi:hypothetical protein
VQWTEGGIPFKSAATYKTPVFIDPSLPDGSRTAFFPISGTPEIFL